MSFYYKGWFITVVNNFFLCVTCPPRATIKHSLPNPNRSNNILLFLFILILIHSFSFDMFFYIHLELKLYIQL